MKKVVVKHQIARSEKNGKVIAVGYSLCDQKTGFSEGYELLTVSNGNITFFDNYQDLMKNFGSPETETLKWEFDSIELSEGL